MTIFHFTIIRSLRSRNTLIALALIPIIMILIPPLWYSEQNTGFNLYGIAIMYGAFVLVRAIMNDRVSGTVTRIFAAPVTTFQYLFQNLLAYLLLLAMQIFLILGLGMLLYNWNFMLSLQLSLCYTIFAATSISFSLAWNSLFRNKLMADGVFSIVVNFMAILGGVFFSIDKLPGILEKVAMLFPNYWLSNALYLLQANEGLEYYYISIAILLLFTIAYLIFGSKRRLE